MKKYFIIIVLFLLPISVYLFFATGVNNFVKLPIVSEEVSELNAFQSMDGLAISLEDKITVLLFFGNDVEAKKANAFNLAHKIYKKNHQFEEFQFITLITEDQKMAAENVMSKLEEIESPEHWKFAIGSVSDIEAVHLSLQTSGALNESFGTDMVFIIDKERNLRGRTDDEDYGVLYGYNAADYAEINNKMSDDIKVVLAEYRLALKKYSSDREI